MGDCVLSELFLMRSGYAQQRGNCLPGKPREGISQGSALDRSLDLFDGVNDGGRQRLHDLPIDDDHNSASNGHRFYVFAGIADG